MLNRFVSQPATQKWLGRGQLLTIQVFETLSLLVVQSHGHPRQANNSVPSLLPWTPSSIFMP
ncbi:hypothetical protein Hanom_Chr14g01274391 [Helianthus anomalus]